jgi:hypothetical protein
VVAPTCAAIAVDAASAEPSATVRMTSVSLRMAGAGEGQQEEGHPDRGDAQVGRGVALHVAMAAEHAGELRSYRRDENGDEQSEGDRHDVRRSDRGRDARVVVLPASVAT